MTTGFRSSFQDELNSIIQKGISHLIKTDLFDPATHGPDVEKIIEEVTPFLGNQRNPPPQAIKTAIAMGTRTAPAYEALGQLKLAMSWYRIGLYCWRGLSDDQQNQNELPDYGWRMTGGKIQINSAICADRVGESEVAQQVFRTAVRYRSISDEELRGFDKTKQPYAVWEWAIERAYALLRLGEYELAHKAAEEALHWIGKDRRAKLGRASEMPLLILPTVLALIHYELNPSPENRAEAVRLLDLDAVSSRIHVDHLQALFYLFNLRAKYLELAAPDDAELPPAARAQQGAEACRRWTSKAGIHLDDSLESLKVMDKHLKEIYRNIQDDDQRKLALFMLGSYYGNIVRHELAGGKWNFAADAMLSWTVDWVLGEVELQLWPFQRVHEYATGKTDESLMDLWEETEQAYIEFGLAARLNE